MKPDLSDEFYAKLSKIVAIAVTAALVTVCIGLIFLTIATVIAVST